MGIPLRSPQMETLMILVFISASLWGCLGCEYFNRNITGQMEAIFDGNPSQITSNGNTDDYCVHKCYSLGLSWL